MRVRVNSLSDRLFRALPALLAALGVVAGAAPRAHAAAYTYGTRQRTINAGILLVDDQGSNTLASQNGGTYSVDPDPYVFYILNQRQDLKPFGWNIVNPIAPSNVTGDILAAWDARDANAYQLNQVITPNMAAYWEVSLSKTSLTNLEKFDVLLLNVATSNVRFTDAEVNELRRYVDNGGQLWIEGSGGTIGNTTNTAPGLLFLDLSFNTASTDTNTRYIPGTGGFSIPQPIIATPYLLEPQELNELGTPNNGATNSGAYDLNGASGSLDTSILSTVAQTASATPVISAGQYGAGQVIVDGVGAAANINNSLPGIAASNGQGGNYGPNSGPYCDSEPNDALAVPDPDLKFAYDILSWSAAHPNEHKNSHQSSQTAATVGPALTTTWTYAPGYTGATTPGAAINGSFVYVRTADGVLRAFNATPGTDIIGTGNPDAGFPDYVNGTPYDEVWDTANSSDGFSSISTGTLTDALASAPTVATVPNVGPVVFVEKANGQVAAFNAVTGASAGTLGTAQGNFSGGVAAPAPTYFGGRLYAAEPNGSLYVHDFNANTDADYSLGSTNAGEHAVAPPTVGLVHENTNAANTSSQNGNGYVDDVVVTVTTNYGTYTVHAGARHDPLSAIGNTYTPSAVNPAPANGPASVIDILQAGAFPFYYDNAGYQDPTPYMPDPLAAGSTGFNPTTAPAATPVFGDYDVDFAETTNTTNNPNYYPGNVVRAIFNLGDYNGASTPSAGAVSAPALDANGNFYYTATVGADSTIVGAHESRSTEANPSGRFSATQILWRFRLPTNFVNDNSASQPDADGVSYAPLTGYFFVGAPVVDSQGNVFALATNGTSSAVLCFNATYSPFVTIPVTNANGTVNVIQITQPLTGTALPDAFNDQTTIIAGTNQFNTLPDNNGGFTIQNFGSSVLAPTGTAVTPNLSEPLPLQVTYSQSTTGGQITNTVTGLFHTNLTWFTTPLGVVPAPNAGLTLVGNYLFFADNGAGSTTGSGIQRLYAYPQSAGLVSAARQYNTAGTDTPDGRPTFQAAATTQAGEVSGILSAGNGVMVANGTTGVQTFGTRYSLVSDATRVLEVDSDGVPSWLVDGTSEINTSTKRTTHVALNRPTSVTQVTPNDYLVADTGNNRCVRFDRAGNVIWEMTRFNDLPLGTSVPFYTSPLTGNSETKTAPLLAPGEPTTLNHPTSVTSYIQTVRSGTTIEGTIVHYLIADTGNSRIVEVVDAFNATGAPVGVPHDLVWVSRTADALGRHYAYTSANYFVGPGNLAYIAALVSNARIAPIPASGRMAPARQDAPGSSIVLLDYDPADPPVAPAAVNANGQADGYISHTISAYLTYLGTGGTFNVAGAPKYQAVSGSTPTIQAASVPPTLTYLRNPRLLQTYTPQGGTGALQNFLLADDNGVFDLRLDPTGADSGATPSAPYANYMEATWGFTQADYQNLAGNLPGLSVTRGGVPFRPNSLQRTGTDPVTVGTTTYLLGHYLATNGFSTGEVTPVSGFGGEVLELADTSGNALQTNLVTSFGNFAQGATPGIAAPLSQPTFATHEK